MATGFAFALALARQACPFLGPSPFAFAKPVLGLIEDTRQVVADVLHGIHLVEQLVQEFS